MGQVTGVVTRVEAGRARVECGVSNQPACGTCAAGRGCGWQRSNQPRRIEIDAQQGTRTLAPGDQLEVRIDDARLLRAACRLYLPPLAGLLAGPALLLASEAGSYITGEALLVDGGAFARAL